MTLADRLIQRPPRETSGSRTANRYDYQKDWVVCLLLRLYLQRTRYLVICEHHEDIIVVDDESDPNMAAYYQVKTKAGSYWNLGDLLKQEKASDGTLKLSPLAKLYTNCLGDLAETESLNFLSNAHYNLKLNSGSKGLSLTTIHCGELDVSEMEKVRTQLSQECNCQCDLPDVPVLVFEVSPLSLQDHCGHAKGKVTEFLDIVIPGRNHRTVLVYRELFEEVRRKTDCEDRPSSFSELRTSKGIGRTAVAAMVEELAAKRDLGALWSEIR